MITRYFVAASLLCLIGCGGGGSSATAAGSASSGGGEGGSGGASSTSTTGAGGGSATASTGTGTTGCVPQPQIIACWTGDAAQPPGPGTKSPSRCREYTGENGTKDPHQWDASCVPGSFTHAIATCPSGATSRCVANCGKPQEFVDFNYDGGGSQLICEGSGGVWLMP